MNAKPKKANKKSDAYGELLSAAALVSTRWLEGKLTKHEIGRLGRACVSAMQAGIQLDTNSPSLNPVTGMLTISTQACLAIPPFNVAGSGPGLVL